MDVVFLRSNELNWEYNFERAKSIVGNDIKLIDGSSAGSVKKAYELVVRAVDTEYFMMIEADNYLHDNCAKWIGTQEKLKFFTDNKYGVQYEHGGVKIMQRTECIKQLRTNSQIHDNFEVNVNMFLTSVPIVVSNHSFNWSRRNEWMTIARELIKLHYWGKQDHIDMWIAHEYPSKVYGHILKITENVGFTELFTEVLPNLGNIYDRATKK